MSKPNGAWRILVALWLAANSGASLAAIRNTYPELGVIAPAILAVLPTVFAIDLLLDDWIERKGHGEGL